MLSEIQVRQRETNPAESHLYVESKTMELIEAEKTGEARGRGSGVREMVEVVKRYTSSHKVDKF